ncbi:ABC transporter substrate-binding protein, partial [Streptomyces sp. NPDC002491]
ARGESLEPVATGEVPTRGGEPVASVLLTPVSVTVDNIGDTVVKDGLHTVQQICTPQLRAACDRAGLT